MWVVAFAFCTVCLLLTWWILKNQEYENTEKQLEKDSYNQKMKKLNEAKELLRSNQSLASLYSALVTIYTNENSVPKSEKSKIMMKILRQTDDIALATAVCAIAKIEAKKRNERTYVKRT